MEKRKSLQELTLLDRFLFNATVEVPENMQAMLEIIMGRDLALKYLPQTEKEQKTSPKLRYARLDVWTQDTDDVVYDMEAQNRNTGNLPKRSRYYQSLLDYRMLKPGVVDFNLLNPVVIIIIAPFDLFGKERYMYTFSMQCEEEASVKLDDGATRIFLNTHGKDDEYITPELKELLTFIEHTNDDDVIASDRVRRLRESVRSIQENEEVGIRYMNAWEEVLLERQDAKAEGEKEDRQRINALITRLEETNRIGDVFKAARDPVYQEKLLKEFGL